MNNLQIVCIACCFLPALIIEIMRRRANSDLLDESSEQTASADSVSLPFLTTVFLTLVGQIVQTLYLIGKTDLSANLTALSSLQGVLLSASWLLSLIFLASLRRSAGTIFPI